MSVQLLNAGHVLVAQADEGLGVGEAGAHLARNVCLTLPADLVPGDYHLQLVVYDWATLRTVPLMEGPEEGGVYWGDGLVLVQVTVE